MPGVDGLLDKISSLAALPLSESTPLPPEPYHSQELYELERSRLFAGGWVCPGMAAEIPKPGDYICFSIGDQPFFSIRGRDGQVHSYSNAHRLPLPCLDV
jgi:phenylpropionate dioxygenase-like ring-hydroxylating dioxygenase large terminal subunit